MLEGRHHHHPRIVAEDVLGAVAVVYIEIDDCDTLETMDLQRMERADRHVVEQAEAHRTRMLCMVARRTDCAERIVHLATGDQVGRAHRRAGSVPDRVERMRVHRGIGIDLAQPGGRRRAFQGIDHARIMGAFDLFPGGCRGGLAAQRHGQCGVSREPVLDRRQTLWTLGMVIAHVVQQAAGMGQPGGGHRGSPASREAGSSSLPRRSTFTSVRPWERAAIKMVRVLP